MRDITLSEDGSINFKDVTTDVDEIMQSIRIILETKLGEFLEDTKLGLDRADLLERSFNERYAIQAIRDALKQDDRVETINNIAITADFHTRKAKVEIDLIVNGNAKTTEVAFDVGQ